MPPKARAAIVTATRISMSVNPASSRRRLAFGLAHRSTHGTSANWLPLAVHRAVAGDVCHSPAYYHTGMGAEWGQGRGKDQAKFAQALLDHRASPPAG